MPYLIIKKDNGKYALINRENFRTFSKDSTLSNIFKQIRLIQNRDKKSKK